MAPHLMSVALIIVAVSFNGVHALNCYSCHSNDVYCRVGFFSFLDNIESCVGSIGGLLRPKCYKITAKNRMGDEYVSRGCNVMMTYGCEAIAKAIGWISDKSSDDANDLSDLECYTCDTDRCNSATRLAGFALPGFFMVLFVVIF